LLFLPRATAIAGEERLAAERFGSRRGRLDLIRGSLDVLQKHGVKATFFWLGQQMEDHADVVRAAVRAGHTVGNHSYSHPHSRELTEAEFWHDQTHRTQVVAKSVLGSFPSLYRPPFGEITDAQIELLGQKGFKVVGWSVDTKDWSLDSRAENAPRKIFDLVMAHVHPQAIILMHDGAYGFAPNSIEAVDILIPALQAQGYEFVTVDVLLGVSAHLSE
jgi:peptidoglycan/xylan/chitin deacetylase (PgdA/CDA1 family)